MRPSLAVAALVLCLLPAASAHETVTTDDGRYRVVVGQLHEPVVTYQKSGLDICFRENNEAQAPVAPDVARLNATLTSPDGTTLSQPLRAQFGRPGCYQFQSSYILTDPGQYTVDLEGDLKGTAVAFKGVKAGGAVTAMEDVTFPNRQVPTNEALGASVAEVAALKAQLATLQADLAATKSQVQALEANGDDGEGADAPFPAGLALLGVLLGVAFLRRS